MLKIASVAIGCGKCGVCLEGQDNYCLSNRFLGVNKPGNFNIRPTPKAGAQLVQDGPYRWIRHPMYSAILIAGQAGVTTAPNAGQSLLGLLWVAMLAVLLVKLLLEERLMLAQYPGYAAYQARTKRLLPGLY